MSLEMLTFGPGGPKGVTGGLPKLRLGNKTKRTSDGKVVSCKRYYLWYFAPKQELPLSRSWQQAHDWVKWVFQHSMGWSRASVWFGEARTPAEAHFIFQYVDPPLRCGGEDHAIGCSSGGLVRIVNTNIGTPVVAPWFSRGVLHEGAHEAFNARHDGDGIMRIDGSNSQLRWPSSNDILAVYNKYVA
jgi:hypothetical protein